MGIEKFSEDVIEKLKNYVYAYVNGEGKIFYIGRGIGNRAFSHLYESQNDDKNHNWAKLQEIDESTKVYIVHSGLTEDEAKHCETALINICRFINGELTNDKVGDRFIHGMIPVETIQNLFSNDNLLLETAFKPEECVAVFAYTKKFYKPPQLTDVFFDKLQRKKGFSFSNFTIESEGYYINRPPQILCVIHDKVVKGIYRVNSTVSRDYTSRTYAFAFITFEIDNYEIPKEFEHYVGRRIEKLKSKYSINETDNGKVYFLY